MSILSINIKDMSNPCSDPVTCLNLNCIGCLDGEIFCQDPRCAPYCPGGSNNVCAIQDDHDFNSNMVMIVIIMSLVAILFIVWFIYGPRLFRSHEDHEEANVIVPTSH